MNAQTSPGAMPPAKTPSRAVWLMAGVLGAASVAAGAGMLVRESSPTPAVQTAAQTGAPAAAQTPAPAPAHATAADPKPARAPAPKAVPAPAPAPARVAQATGCHDCGVVESVRSVTRKGEGSGLGAVAGGVLGAAVGNQMGKGNGRSAMTVLGAVGGGMAGHEIEKRSKSSTVHEVKVRMDDGSLRTVEQAQAPQPGERVRVDGRKLVPLAAGQAG